MSDEQLEDLKFLLDNALQPSGGVSRSKIRIYRNSNNVDNYLGIPLQSK
jgi:hypothetical protein